MRVRVHGWLSVVLLFAPAVAHAQSTFTWDPAGVVPNWTGPANWTGGPASTYPGVPNGGGNAGGHVNDLAVIEAFAFSAGNGLAINFDTINGGLPDSTDGLLSLGGIDFTTTTANLQIGNSSGSVNGVLQLNGATVNGVANTLIAVRGTRNLTVANVQSGGGGQTMRLDLGISNGLFLVSTARILTISSVIGEAGGSHGFTTQGLGGTVRLLGTNTYTGTTTTNIGSTLQVGNGGTVGTLGSGTVRNNGTLTFNRSDSVSVSNTISGTGTLNFAGTGSTTLTGVLAPGNSGLGTTTVVNTLNLSGVYQAELGSGSASDQLSLSAGPNTLNLNNGSTVNLVASGFTRTPATFTLADLQGTGASLLQLNGVGLAADTDITKFTADGLGGGSFSTINGSVNLTATGFGSLLSGDTLTLRRSAGGDLVAVFTPVPEPGTVLGVCALVAGGVAGWRRWRTVRPN